MKETPLFDELVLSLQGKLHTVAYALLLSHDEALDVVQEAFIKAWQQTDFFESGFNQKAWLFKVVRNLALNRRRTISRLWQWMKKQVTEAEPEKQSIVETLIHQEKVQLLNQYMQKLSLAERETLALYYSGGYDCQEIADMTGTKKGTITSRLKRARERLGVLMQTKGDFYE
jgi:RNA polymerase sigma-70 factor (ECF subfamily)